VFCPSDAAETFLRIFCRKASRRGADAIVVTVLPVAGRFVRFAPGFKISVSNQSGQSVTDVSEMTL
jgi:hypothetical protein